MAALTVRDLDDDVKQRLRVRAAQHGRSMEAEARAILVEAVRDQEESDNLLVTIMDRFGAVGGVELELPPRSTPARAADLDS